MNGDGRSSLGVYRILRAYACTEPFKRLRPAAESVLRKGLVPPARTMLTTSTQPSQLRKKKANREEHRRRDEKDTRRATSVQP